MVECSCSEDTKEGTWVTVKGTRIFIETGQTTEAAITKFIQSKNKKRLLEKASKLEKTPIAEEKEYNEMSKKELIGKLVKCKAGDFMVYDFRDDLSVSDSIQACVAKSLGDGKDLGQAYRLCRARQDFLRMTPEQYLEDFTGDALSSNLNPRRARPMLTLAEAVRTQGGSGSTTSSTIAKVGYANSMLEVEFNTGKRYVYFVGPEYYEGLINAPSKGKYLWDELRGKEPGLVFDDPTKITPGGMPYAGGSGGKVPYTKGTSGQVPEEVQAPELSLYEEKEQSIAQKELEIAFRGKGMKWKTGLPGMASNDFSMNGFITRSGEFDYGPAGIKSKKWDNIKDIFDKTSHFPVFGAKQYGAHTEAYDALIGYAHGWEYFEPNDIDKEGHVYANIELFSDISELSDLKDPSDLPVSIGFIDLGEGDTQHITKLRHLAVSLNKLEGDRCNTAGGMACSISKKNEVKDMDVKGYYRTVNGKKVWVKAHKREGESSAAPTPTPKPKQEGGGLKGSIRDRGHKYGSIEAIQKAFPARDDRFLVVYQAGDGKMYKEHQGVFSEATGPVTYGMKDYTAAQLFKHGPLSVEVYESKVQSWKGGGSGGYRAPDKIFHTELLKSPTAIRAETVRGNVSSRNQELIEGIKANIEKKGFKPDRYGNWKNDEWKQRVKFSTTSFKIEKNYGSKVDEETGKFERARWQQIGGGYYNKFMITPEGKLLNRKKRDMTNLDLVNEYLIHSHEGDLKTNLNTNQRNNLLKIKIWRKKNGRIQ